MGKFLPYLKKNMYVIKQFGFCFYLDKKFYAKNIPIQMITLKNIQGIVCPTKQKKKKKDVTCGEL